MTVAGSAVLYDACVLYPAPLRDLLMRLALIGLYRARWSREIHEEWIESLLARRPDLGREQLDRTRRLMDRAVPDALVEGYGHLVPTLVLPDPGDRHVLAAAIHGGAEVIVTYNLKDFPADALAEHGLGAEHPDAFVSGLIEQAPGRVLAAVRDHRASLKSPPKTVEDYLATLEGQDFTKTITALRAFAHVI